MEKVAVFPVPDWACAITSWPLGNVSHVSSESETVKTDP